MGKEAVMQEPLSPFQVLLSCFTISSLGGFFSYLRSDNKFRLRDAVAITFYTGLVGLVIGLLWFTWFAPDNLFFLIGVSGLAGLGGSTAIDIVLKLIKSGGIQINIQPKDDEEK